MRWRRGAFDSRWVRYLATRAAWRIGLSRKMPSRSDGLPHRGEPVGTLRAGVGGDERAVERADAGAEHEVGPDAVLGERPQHPHLGGAEHAAAPQDVRGELVARHTGQSRPVARRACARVAVTGSLPS